MLSLDEAITNEREKAEGMYLQGMLCHANPNDDELDVCIECAKEHEQLAEWLEELKDLREMKETIECNAEVLERQGYNNAIDDTLEILKFHEDEWDGIYHAIDEIENLKESYE